MAHNDWFEVDENIGVVSVNVEKLGAMQALLKNVINGSVNPDELKTVYYSMSEIIWRLHYSVKEVNELTKSNI